MADEYVYIGTTNGKYKLPVQEPDGSRSSAVRMGVPVNGGEPRAFKLVTDPPDDSDHAVRIGLPDGSVGALSRTTANTLADFENGDWPDTWTNETTYYDLTSNALRGAWSLQPTGGDYGQIANPTLSTPRGNDYSVLAELNGGDAAVWLLTNVQDENNAMDDNYAARLDPDQNELSIYKRTNESTTNLDTVSVSLSKGTTYEVVLAATTDTVRARVLDSSGTEVAATAEVTDTTHSGGYLGLYTNGSDPVGTRYDNFVQYPY
jgi:hypothetical protein